MNYLTEFLFVYEYCINSIYIQCKDTLLFLRLMWEDSKKRDIQGNIKKTNGNNIEAGNFYGQYEIKGRKLISI